VANEVDNRHRISCCLSFDFDAMSGLIGGLKTNNPSMISRGEFAAVGVPRVLRLLREHGIQATFFIPGHTVHAYPDLVDSIAADEHEVAHHGWGHENPSEFDVDGERRNLERGLEALQNTVGIRARGYRSPAWDLSPHTFQLLLDHEFVYDSSCMGGDFYPYYLRIGDKWSATEPYVFGATCPLVELPITWGLDDVPFFEVIPGQFQGLAAPSVVEERWKADFDYAYRECADGIFTLTLHPEVIGRGYGMLLLERLIAHFESREGVRFERLIDYAERWKAAHPIEEWKSHDRVHVRPPAPNT
jgi:peptidoglycan/xylan/chitin deacetylase (PgdA/CDA1 family)